MRHHARAQPRHQRFLASLERFDRYYFGLYPYLDRYVRADELRGKDVLEVGLGYGTVAQRIAQAGARYSGLDIAQGPVEVVNLRLSMNGLPGRAQVGSILDAPFPPESFDAVVTIGCLHHTGNLPRAIDEVHRVLRPGGRALIMVYNAFSYRRWLKWPAQTWQDWRKGAQPPATEAERAAYDAGTSGSAPETVFTSIEELRHPCRASRRAGSERKTRRGSISSASFRGPCFFPPSGRSSASISTQS